MGRSRSQREACGVALALLLAACTEDAAPAEEPGEALPARVTSGALPTQWLHASRSDAEGVELGGTGYLNIQPDLRDVALRRVELRANVWSETDGSVSTDLQGLLSDTQLTALARGERVELLGLEQGDWPAVTFRSSGLPESQRVVLAATMTREAHSARLVLELGDEFTEWPPPTENTDPVTVELRGQFSVVCEVFRVPGSPIFDPMWRSDFCRTARSDLGLSEWIEDLL